MWVGPVSPRVAVLHSSAHVLIGQELGWQKAFLKGGKWRHQVLPKRWYLPTELPGDVWQNTIFVSHSKKYVELTLYYLKIGFDIAGCKHTDFGDLHNTGVTPIHYKQCLTAIRIIEISGIILPINYTWTLCKKAAFFQSQICPPGLSREHCSFGHVLDTPSGTNFKQRVRM
jgi:hypothetical protein